MELDFTTITPRSHTRASLTTINALLVQDFYGTWHVFNAPRAIFCRNDGGVTVQAAKSKHSRTFYLAQTFMVG